MKNNQDKTRELQLYMDNMKQRTLGGSQLWIRGNFDCLAICRNHMSEASVESVEGEWTEEEIEMAKYLYQFTEAAQR